MKIAEVKKAQELAYELRVGRVMTRDTVTATPDMTLREVGQVMRDRRISGLPVLDDGRLAGVISLQDLITALERRALGAKVDGYMTRALHVIREDEPAVNALAVFARTGVGRLPVVNADGALVGVLTPGDITRGMLNALQDAFQQEELRQRHDDAAFDGLTSDRTSVILRYAVAAHDFSRAGRASSALKQALNRIGLDPRIVRRVAIASYEAEMNVVIHSTGGRLVAEITPEWVSILTCDDGPGIPDVGQARQPGFSTAPDWIREMGFGAGMGLSNIEACSDEMRLESSPQGTRLEVVIYLKPTEGKKPDECR
jgi:CBS domain-containing protein/anti-sigma regulatory factor (Ser/Thr protein kinase)